MQDINIGHIIKNLRLNKAISSSKLCFGLCSPSMLTRIESGERYPSKLLFDALMERMGESGHNYNLIGTKREIELYDIIQEMRSDNRNGDYKKLEKYFSQYEKIMNPRNVLELQTQSLIKCILSKDCTQIYDISLSALNLTIKNFDYTKISTYLLSHNERLLINTLACCYNMKGNIEISIHIFRSLLYFIEEYICDDYERDYIEPTIVFNLSASYFKLHNFQELLYYSKKGISLNIANHSTNLLGRFYYEKCYATLAVNPNSLSPDIILAYYFLKDIGNPIYADHLRKDIETDHNLRFEIIYE